ncbi:MAG TPA: Gmad2 immunoglobulin-like domain-containing protein [Candidatus Paceibacterota bacterium]|nr:Gmad2 immunoglobulin-like domain-containing protein [Candidatus Paceibacterota bacterium]
MKKTALVVVILIAAVAGYLYFTGRYRGIPWLAAPTPLSDSTMVLSEPWPGERVTSPLTVRGQARGTWYFEATFPVVLEDAAGNVLVQTPARAQSDWETTDFVPFQATLTFTAPAAGTHGTLILKKDNPSGLPQNDDSREIPVLF